MEKLENKTKKRFTPLYLLIGVGLIGVIVFLSYNTYQIFLKDKEKKEFSVEGIKKLLKLASIRVEVEDIVVKEKEKLKGLFKFKGVVELGVDLDKLEYEILNTESRAIFIKLPQIEAIFHKIDGERSTQRVEETESWYQRSASESQKNNFVTEAYVNGEKQILEDVLKDDFVLKQTKKQTEMLLVNFYKKSDWKVQFKRGVIGDDRNLTQTKDVEKR